MQIFVILKEGVYRHECCGVYTTEEIAAESARALAEADSDDYHSYIVIPYTVNQLPKTIKGYYNSINEPDEIFKCSKETK
jgi:hypothetical protein